MLGAALRTNRRLRSKQPPPRLPQASLPAPLELEAEAPGDARRQVYLVTLPCPKPGSVSADGIPLVAPGSKTKEEVLRCFLDACAHPVYANLAQPGHTQVQLEKAGLWREYHAGDPSSGERNEHDGLADPALDEPTNKEA